MSRTATAGLHLMLLPALLTSLTGGLVAQERGDRSRPSRASDKARIRRRLAEWVEQTRAGNRVGAEEIWAPDLVGWYPGQPDDSYAREQERARRPRAADLRAPSGSAAARSGPASGYGGAVGRMMMAEAAVDPKLGTLLRMHEEAYRQLGGVPKGTISEFVRLPDVPGVSLDVRSR